MYHGMLIRRRRLAVQPAFSGIVKSTLIHILLVFCLCATAVAQAGTAADSVVALIHRVVPQYESHFVVETIPAENGSDVFELESRNDKIVLRGNNGVSMASALNWYLKYTCHCQVSWCGDQLDIPTSVGPDGRVRLPVIKEKIRQVSPHAYRYAFNYCTFGYAMAFWDWERWEREIDFMALNGINAPLAATGFEVIYRNVYRQLGIPDREIDGFIAAPPFVPWFLMGNLDGWGGPNPAAWYDRQEALQKKIMARELELGMKPILPAFGGHVPAQFKNKFPGAKVAQLKNWGGFPGVYVLDPTDPMFREVGARFIRESTRLYGTSHLYSADTFNEVDPPTTDLTYLTGMGKQVYQSMADADPQAVWVMQGWLFLFSANYWSPPRIEALLADVPADKMIILDLFADGKPQWQRTKAFAGKQWLWCIVNNWGGKQGMYGRLQKVGVEMPKIMGTPSAGKLAGIGSLNEGNDTNPIVYDELYEMAWHDKPLDITEWVTGYVHRRYGRENQNALKAWLILAEQLYNCKDTRHGPQGNYLSMEPSLNAGGTGFVRGDIFYSTAKIQEAFKLLLDASAELGRLDTYRHDIVDVGRQVMSDLAQKKLHAELRAALAAGDARRFDLACAAYYEALGDADRLLRTHTMFQLGRYLQYPCNAGSTDAENARWEQNARRLITLWGNMDSPLYGYAQRQYGGLMADYNLNCWKIFFASASSAIRAGRKFEGDRIKAQREVRKYTEEWIHKRDKYPVQAEGDAVAVAGEIWRKYCTSPADTASTLASDILGRWQYEADGKTCVREFGANGVLRLYVNGKAVKSWEGFKWSIENNEIICRSAAGAVVGRHRLKDLQTLEFLQESLGPAVREIQHKE